jgi:hypothetical protein
VEKEQLIYEVEGDITLRNHPFGPGIDLVLIDAQLTPCGRKKRDVVLRLSPGQWKVLAALLPQRERRQWLMQTASAELKEFWNRQQEDAEAYKHELVHKLGMDDWSDEDLPHCLRH